MSEIYPETPPVPGMPDAEPWRAAWLAFTDAAGFTRVPPTADAHLDTEWIAAWTAAAKAGATAEVRLLRGTLALRDAEIEQLRARLDGNGSRPGERHALVELMGHRSMVGAVQEVTFLGEPRLEIHRIDTVPPVTVTVGAESIYALTALSAEQADAMSRGYDRSDCGLAGAGVVTRYIDEHRRAIAAAPDHDDDEDIDDADVIADGQDAEDNERELAEEGNQVGLAYEADDGRDHHPDEGNE
jgi:hypothetical protein